MVDGSSGQDTDYPKVTSSNTSCLEAHEAFFRLVMKRYFDPYSRVSNIESDNSQNVGLEDYNNIFDRIFPYFTTPSIKITLTYLG